MEFVEYPKQLYGSGWEDLSDTVVVNSADEEESARAQGFKMLSEPEEAAAKKRTRKAAE